MGEEKIGIEVITILENRAFGIGEGNSLALTLNKRTCETYNIERGDVVVFGLVKIKKTEKKEENNTHLSEGVTASKKGEETRNQRSGESPDASPSNLTKKGFNIS